MSALAKGYPRSFKAAKARSPIATALFSGSTPIIFGYSFKLVHNASLVHFYTPSNAARLKMGKIDETEFTVGEIVNRDVAILGGGGSGAHAAVLLKQDHMKSVVVIEKQDHLVLPNISKHA